MRQQWIDLTVAILGRAPSEEELFTWFSQEESVSSVANQLQNDTAAQARFSFGEDSAQLLNSAYASLFDRTPDPEGLAYWLTQLENGTLDQASLIPALLEGARASTGDTVDAALLNQRLDAATTFLTQLEESNESFSADNASSVVSAVTRDNLAPIDPPSDASPAIELVTGNPAITIQHNSTLQDGVSKVVFSESDGNRVIAEEERLFANSTNDFGSVMTLTKGDEVLELVTINLIESGELRDLASDVGYDGWIDMALFNGDLVTPASLGISEQEFFSGENDLEFYFGYDWPFTEASEAVISRPDGETFTAEFVLYDALGIANLDAVFDAFS